MYRVNFSYSFPCRTHTREAGSFYVVDPLVRRPVSVRASIFPAPYIYGYTLSFNASHYKLAGARRCPLPYSTPSETAAPPSAAACSQHQQRRTPAPAAGRPLSPSPLVVASHLPFSNSGGASSPLHRRSRWALAAAAPTTFQSLSPWY